MTPSDFTELLARWRDRGEPDGLNGVLAAFQDRLLAAARHRLGGAETDQLDPQDVVQSAQKSLLLALRKGRYDIRDEDRLLGFALHILRRKVAQKFARSRRDRELRAAVARQTASADETAGGPARRMESAELANQLLELMGGTERDLARRIMAGESIADAARGMGISPPYARVILSRLRKELAKIVPDFRDLD